MTCSIAKYNSAPHAGAQRFIGRVALARRGGGKGALIETRVNVGVARGQFEAAQRATVTLLEPRCNALLAKRMFARQTQL